MLLLSLGMLASSCLALAPAGGDADLLAWAGASPPGPVGQAENRSASSANPAEIFSQGKQALAQGQLSLAEQCFRQVIALDPKSAPAFTNLAVTYMRERRWDDALAELGQANLIRPVDPGIELNIGLSYYRRNDFASAIHPFKESLQHAPGSVQARYLLGLCYFFNGQYKDAASTLRPLWDKESRNLNYLYVLSIAASKASEAALQQQAFAQMLAIGQDTPEFHLYVGKAWLAEDDTPKALEEFKTAALAQPNLPLVHYFLGRTYLEQHAYVQAEEELLKDAGIEPDFAYDYEDLGILYAQVKNAAKAEEYFLGAVAHNSSLVNSFFGLAKLYRESGRLNEALVMLGKAEALAPQSASLHYTKGQILAKLGEREKAQEEFARSAELLHSFNNQLQQTPSGDRSADAQGAAEQ